MKKILSLLAVILFAAIGAFSQAPNIFNYQGVARNSVGNVLINQSIALRITIHDGAPAGPVVYQEVRGVTTNPFGLFNAQVGSAGFTSQIGTIAAVPWGVGNKYIQVEIDPSGGSSFINIGTAQIASVPYALFSTASGDLVLPFNKTQADAGTLFKITNSGTGSGSTSLEGLTNSTAGNVSAIIGTVTTTTAGGFSAGVKGINNGTTGNGIGVWGTQNGSGWGVYGITPSGIGVYGNTSSGTGVLGSSTSGVGVNGVSTSGIGVLGTSATNNAGRFDITNAANNTDALVTNTNGGAASWALRATSTGAQGAGIFTYNNPAGTAATIRATNNGGGFAVSATTTGTNSAGSFQNSNAANTNPTLSVNSNATAGTGINSTMSGTGQVSAVSGFISTTTGASAGINGADFSSGGASPIEARTFGVLGQTGTTGIAVGGYASAGGTALRGSGGGPGGFALSTTGNVRHTGIGEAPLRILATVTGNGDATWVDPSAIGGVTGSGTVNFVPKWTPIGTNLANSQIFDNGTNVGVNTAAPTHRLTVSHGGATGILVTSTAAFSVVDINAQNGDAALRFGNNGVNQWNIRNRPADNYLEFFELGAASRMVIQDGTGNVGIGNTVAPAYRLDVQHGGATGIRSQSTASFSVVDIDAFNGDAALRFQLNGVGQWNTRNRPADNYYEIFELGGGGSRVVIQDGTGNVGIGETTNPTYKLDVLHGGATGIRSRSTASFSVVDIDGATGDAALRFIANGVNQWNTRNRPADNYYEIFELGGGGSRVVIQDGTGNVGIGATTSPSYKLDVEHGGATGIRSLSTGSFSVVDIDGFTGDAALRFQKQGVGMWNTRNRPADDYFEIFELGGGGSRVVIQDGTGNVGIGETTSPSYRLDVLHGGATGIRSRSTGSFSLMDIDAQNGDAALRFAKAGVNQWNIRNRPADDYLEIFELAGGGSRVVIQDGTGNVGVGETTNPVYRLDVLHGGATGIRSRSSGTFSLVDIDAQNGDAALRFAKAGVNQWNIRNNPANDDLQFFELGGGGERMRIENTTGNVVIAQNLNVVGTLSKGAGAFKIDHPLDPENKYLWHSFVESPDMMNIYNGNIVTDASGKAIVELPDYFQALNMEYRYQLTVIGSFAQAIINKEVANNKFEIATNLPNVKVSWQVTGVRNDAYAQKHRIPNTVEKEQANKGKYLSPESFNQPKSKGIGYDVTVNSPSSLNHVAPVSNKAAAPTSGGSLDQKAIVPPASKSVDQSGSVAPVEVSKTVAKPADNSGSVAPQAEVKKAEVKPVELKGTSLEVLPKKAVEEKKAVDPGSTRTD